MRLWAVKPRLIEMTEYLGSVSLRHYLPGKEQGASERLPILAPAWAANTVGKVIPSWLSMSLSPPATSHGGGLSSYHPAEDPASFA